MNKREILIRAYIAQLLEEDNSFLTVEKGVTGIYSYLQDKFLKDAEIVMRKLARDVLFYGQAKDDSAKSERE